MTADNIRKTAFQILHYACDQCDTNLNYEGELKKAMDFIEINNNDDFEKVLAYLRSSQMVDANANYKENKLSIRGICFDAINWIASFHK